MSMRFSLRNLLLFSAVVPPLIWLVSLAVDFDRFGPDPHYVVNGEAGWYVGLHVLDRCGVEAIGSANGRMTIDFLSYVRRPYYTKRVYATISW